jgi:hypothetical protein
VAFVGSPIEADEKELVKLAKKLKKEKVREQFRSCKETVLREFFVSISHQAAWICIGLALLDIGQDLGSEFRSKWVSGSDPNWESLTIRGRPKLSSQNEEKKKN